MNLNWIESIVYGFISGMAEFLPISSKAHQMILLHLCGADVVDPVRDLFVHVALFLSLYTSLKPTFDNMRREIGQRSGRRNHTYVSRDQYDTHLIKNAVFPMLIGLFLISYIFKPESSLLATSAFFLVNGILIFLPVRMMQGNKDARSMSVFDSILLGVFGALSAFPGISRIGCTTSVAVSRGASRQNALHWAFLLSIPAILALSCFDVFGIITYAQIIPFWNSFLTYILSAIFAYLGGYIGIGLMKFLTVRVGFSGFAYYSWGAGLFTFLLYLLVV